MKLLQYDTNSSGVKIDTWQELVSGQTCYENFFLEMNCLWSFPNQPFCE